MATVCFLKRIIEMTDATCDQEHIEMVIEHLPSIPDRTGYLLDRTKPDPVGPIVKAGCELAKMGATEIAIPCITAHGFHDIFDDKIPVKVINGVRLTAKMLAEKGIKKAGVMATDGSLHTGIFERALGEFGIEHIYPSPDAQKCVMSVIYNDVKAGKPVDREVFKRASDELFAGGAEVILLGCTELSVAADEWLPKGRFLDMLTVLARKCVIDFGKLKSEYFDLL